MNQDKLIKTALMSMFESIECDKQLRSLLFQEDTITNCKQILGPVVLLPR